MSLNKTLTVQGGTKQCKIRSTQAWRELLRGENGNVQLRKEIEESGELYRLKFVLSRSVITMSYSLNLSWVYGEKLY